MPANGNPLAKIDLGLAVPGTGTACQLPNNYPGLPFTRSWVRTISLGHVLLM